MPATWSPLRTVAEFVQQGWRVELDPTKPASSLVFVSNHGDRWEALSICPLPQHSLHAEEIYVRQHDLIARFGQTGQDEFGFQVDWRLIETPNGFDVGIEVWISVQTSLLDTAPKIRVSSHGIANWKGWRHQQLIDSEDASHDADRGWNGSHSDTIAGLSSSKKGCSCVWLFEPRDLQQVRWTSRLESEDQQADLFGAFLEKGVIRRARMRLLASHQSIDLLEIQRAYQQLIQSELPLTA